MAVWYKKLYVSESAYERIEEIVRSIDEEDYIRDVYIITLASGEKDQLDIYDSYQMKRFEVLRRRLMPIIGVASNYNEAVKLLEDIAGEVYRETGDLYIRKYFEERL